MEQGYFLNIEYIYNQIYNFFVHFSLSWIMDWIYRTIPRFAVIAAIASIVFIICICIMLYLINKIWDNSIQILDKAGVVSEPVVLENRKWKRVCEHIESKNPSDWRLAILEADIILDEILETMGHHGETIGDKLKQVERSDFTTIDDAWDAHKVRNNIAHQGSDFEITEREARRVIGLYESVFKEFHYI